jgi:hypothetical protein
MSRICKVMLALAVAAVAAPAWAQTASPPSPPDQTPPYSNDITHKTTTTTTTQTTDQGVPTVQPAPVPPPATVPPVSTINVQTAPAPAPNVVVEPAPVVPVETHPVNVNVIPAERSTPQMAISLGGGISEFADKQIRDRTGVNGEYEARVLFGPSNPLAFEAAYVGTAVGLQGLAGENNATLLSNGVEGLARLNLGNFGIQPFAVGGASYVRYSVVNTNVSLSDVRASDDVFAIPFGAGVASYIPDTGLMVDARFIYRATFNDDLVRPTTTNTTGAGLGNWNVSLRLGYAF